MCRSVAMCLGAALAVAAAGCRSCDKVETELRARESDVRELRDRLGQAEFYNQALQRDLCAVRGLPGPHGVLERPSEPFPVRSLVLGRQTGGRPSETLPGDDALQVMVEPRDPEGQAIKAPGTLYVEAVEVSTEGLKKPLSGWVVPPDELRQRWRNGLFTTGYVLTLPWKVWPSTEKLRVVARFQMGDGRVFEADRDVTVRVLPEKSRRSLPPPGAAVMPAPKVEDKQPPHMLPAPDAAPPPAGLPAVPLPVLPSPTPADEGPRLTQGKAPLKVEMRRAVPLPTEP